MPLPRRFNSLPRVRPVRTTGFTLVELLVAIAVLALMSVMSWRAIDGMNQAQTVTREHGESLAELQAALGQWVADLDAVQAQADFSAIDFDGRVLRLVRRDALDGEFRSAGLRVVAWTRHSTSGQWARWQSPPLRLRGELDQAWQRAGQWTEASREPMAGEVRLMPLAGWELFYFRGDAWTNPLSAAGGTTSGTGTTTTTPSLPDGVRLVLQLPAGGVVAGRLQRDWVRPALTRTRS